MPLMDSLSINKTAFEALGKKFEVTGDNLANADTTGFKKSNNQFAEILGQQLSGPVAGQQLGAGVLNTGVQTPFSQGEILSTQSSMDVAINGKGLFPVETPFGRAYTRDGSFRFNKEGYLVNGDGHKVLAYMAGTDGKISQRLAPIQTKELTSPSEATSRVNMRFNLDSREEIKTFDITKPSETSSFEQFIEVYDGQGNSRTLQLFFNKTAANQWEYHVTAPGKSIEGGPQEGSIELMSGQISFSNKGQFENMTQNSTAVTFKGASTQNITFDFGTPLSEGTNTNGASSQAGTTSGLSNIRINGRTEGKASGLNFGNDGVLTSNFSNGESRTIGQLAISSFTNEQGLKRVGQNLFIEGIKSGQAAIGKPGESDRGEVKASSLEVSNVDVSQEMIELMKTQKNFNASAKAFTTIDEMLKTTLQMKG